MAANLALGDLLQVRVVAMLDSQLAINVRHFTVATITGVVTDQDVASTMDGLLAPHYKLVMAIPAVYHGVGVQRLAPGPKPVEQTTIANEGPGVSGAIPLPPQSCGLITFTTALAGRKGRGRNYLPFPSATDNQVDGVPTTTYKTNAGAIAAIWGLAQTVTAGGGGSCSLAPVMWNRATGVTTPITGHGADAAWATQRRRSLFGRLNVAPF